MKITCQSCQSKYNVADEKVQGKIVKIRCRKCGATIVVQGNGGASANGSAGTNGSSASAVADADGAEWHVNVGEGEPRKMSLAELVDAYNAGTVAQDTFIWTDGMDDWKPLSDVEPVTSALHAGAGAGPASVEVPDFRAPIDEVPYKAPAPAPVAVAAAPEPIAEPRRAAVKRDGGRARDFFAGGGGEEVQTSAPAVPAMMAAAGPAADPDGKLTGQRNENSVLFSLAVLTKDADGRTQDEPPRSTTKNNDDSGLIDLKALAAKAESMRPPAVADASPFAAPLGFGGPLGAPLGAMGGAGEQAPKSKVPLYIGLAGGGLLVLILGVFVGVKVVGGGGPETAASAVASAAPVVTAPTAAEPTATAMATASATAEPTASAPAASAKPKPVATYHAPAAMAPKPQAAAANPGAAAPAPAPAPAPKKATSDCGCNGDLMCLMKCSTH